jgi:hypothetical protein
MVMLQSSPVSAAHGYPSYALSLRIHPVRLLLTLWCVGCDFLPQRGDTFGEQSQALWLTSARLVVDTDPGVTLVRLRADTVDSARGRHILLVRYDFNPSPALGDEYSLALGLDLGDVHRLRPRIAYALGPPPAAIPAVGTVTCLCRPLRPDSVRGTFTMSSRGIAQIVARIDATLFFTAWDDSSVHTTYRLRQRLDALR